MTSNVFIIVGDGMNYRKMYNKIIKYRQKHILEKSNDVYTEVHHIKPRCLGGNDDINNLVRLTAREHFLCHCLLAKMYKKGTRKWFQMSEAINIMKGKKYRYINSRLYESIKQNYWEEKNKINEQKTLKQINEICDWIDEKNKIPSTHSSNKYEKKIAKQLSRLKSAKKNNIYERRIFNDSYQKLVEDRNYPDLLNVINYKNIVYIQINEICDFMDKYNKTPKKHSTDKEEKKLGSILNRLKTVYKASEDITYKKIVEYRNYPDLLNVINKEKKGLLQINEICDFIDKYKCKPKQKSKNVLELRLARKLNDLKLAKHYNRTTKFYKSYQKLVETRGYYDLFDIKKEKTKCLI